MNLQHHMFALVQAQRSGEQTITAFCAAHDLSYAKFNYWQRRYDRQNSPVSTEGFVRLTPPSPSPSSSSPGCLHLADGSRLVGSVEQLAAFYRLIQGDGHA